MGIPRRIEAREYDSFVSTLTDSIRRELPNTCFYNYGSYPAGRFIPGVSDIDGGFIFDSDVVIPKGKVRVLSRLLKEAKGEAPIRTQFNLLDRVTNIDGRFLSYEKSYVEWFRTKNTQILLGPNYLLEMKGIDRKTDELRSTAMNLREMRNALLNAEENMGKEYGQEGNINRSLEKSLDKLSALPKKLRVIKGGRVENDKSKGELLLQKTLPKFHSPILEEAVNTRRSQENFRRVVYDSSSEEARLLLEQVVTAYEEIIGEFIKRYPLKE